MTRMPRSTRMIMFEDSIGSRVDRIAVQRKPSSLHGRPFRIALPMWATVALLGAIVAAATCLLGDREWYKESPATTTLIVNSGTIKSIAFRQDGAMLFSVGFDGSQAILDLKTRLEIPVPPQGPGPIRCAAFSPDNRVLATANATATVSLHDLVDHRSRTLHDISASTTDAACLAFSPDGATLAVGQQDGKITLWYAATGRNRSTLLGHTEFVASLAFAPDGTTLASSGGERMTRVWDLPKSRQRFAIASPTSTLDVLVFSPDGRLLCGADTTTPIVRLWDVATGTEPAALRGPAGAVVALAISPDGTTLAAAGYQGVINFWDLATREIRSTRLRHAGVRALAFAPDGQALATGGFDGTIHLWAFPVASDN
jgi:WD40 repeat protein